jgi:GTPase
MPVPPGDCRAIIFIVWSRDNSVKYTDPDGREDDILKVDLSIISDETKVKMLDNVLANLSYKLAANNNIVVAVNALKKGDVNKINELAENYDSDSVNIRKEYFAMTDDSDKTVDSPDYQMYVTSIKEIAQRISVVNRGAIIIGEIHAGIQKLPNPKSISMYKIDKINSINTLSSNISEVFNSWMRR